MLVGCSFFSSLPLRWVLFFVMLRMLEGRAEQGVMGGMRMIRMEGLGKVVVGTGCDAMGKGGLWVSGRMEGLDGRGGRGIFLVFSFSLGFG